MLGAAILAALLLPAAAPAAPEGFRLSTPLTVRAVKIGGHQQVTVWCARTQQVWRDTAQTEEGATAHGRTRLSTREIMLPPARCGSLERWLRGKTVDTELLAIAIFTLTHEVAHAARWIRDELAADCYATRHFDRAARAFGVRSERTLRRLRVEAPLIPSLC